MVFQLTNLQTIPVLYEFVVSIQFMPPFPVYFSWGYSYMSSVSLLGTSLKSNISFLDSFLHSHMKMFAPTQRCFQSFELSITKQFIRISKGTPEKQNRSTDCKWTFSDLCYRSFRKPMSCSLGLPEIRSILQGHDLLYSLWVACNV